MLKIFLLLLFSINLSANNLYKTCLLNHLKTSVSKENFIQDVQEIMKNYGFKKIILANEHVLEIHFDKLFAVIYRQKDIDKFLHHIGDLKFAGIKYPSNAMFVEMKQMKIDLWKHLQEILTDNCEVNVIEMK